MFQSRLIKWVKSKYRLSNRRAEHRLHVMQKESPRLFVRWYLYLRQIRGQELFDGRLSRAVLLAPEGGNSPRMTRLPDSIRFAHCPPAGLQSIGHPHAEQKSAIIHTLLADYRIHRINTQLYFTDVLDKLVPADGNPFTELLEGLLPKQLV